MNFLIFPPQLFYNINHLKNIPNINDIYLIEEPRYFTDFNFHKMKLVYHRASMMKYYSMLKKKFPKTTIHYIPFHMVNNTFYRSIKGDVNMIMLPDYELEDKLQNIYGKRLNIMENINMLVQKDEIENIKKLIYKNNKYSHEEFYKYMRRKLDIMIENNKPEGGKWSYDNMNRLPLPKEHKVPPTNSIKKNKYIVEAIKYVEKHFKDNYGSTEFFYPIDGKSAINWLKQFLSKRLKNFGAYEDAVNTDYPFVYHSVLSPMMNIGIITDMEVVNISYDYYKKHSIPIESFEGFIRQVIGWRNYVYTLYCLEGRKMKKSNELKHNNKLNFKKFWEGTTGILPIDNSIDKIKKYAYVHHIERLMYLGNFMLLCMIDPDDVYRIFMEWTIDSYDWVMVANVYGMSQFASSNMMTRPYFSSSNYILKMSNYKKDNNWNVIWDALYYNFINEHYNSLKKNYATAPMVRHWDNKTKKQQDDLIEIAEKYIKSIK